ncbi:MAG: CoA transferase [Acidobacteria bacterium]|nr:CoA transferase [Acidobacteriota bacterium]
MSSMSKPLDGVRVLDLTRLLPGAYATLLLADLGADVIKIEDPRGGDGMRHLPLTGGVNVYFDRLNRNKRSVTLDLRSPDAAPVLDALVARADVLVESFRPSTARRLGVDAAALRARHPRLICASISGFGQDGPYAERAAHDINYQALAGLLRPPRLPGPLVGDIGSAMTAALRIAAALFERSRTGAGCALDISIHDAALAWSMFPTPVDFPPARYNLYETADGQWLALGALEHKFFAGFCERLGIPVTATVDEVRAVMRTRTRDAWLAHFAGSDVCLTTVHSPAQVAADPQVVARGLMSTPGRNAPALSADTDEILENAGIGAPERARLRSAGVI